jgi:hypothetical protein
MHTRKDNIKINVRETGGGCAKSIGLAQKTNQRRANLDTITETEFYKGGQFDYFGDCQYYRKNYDTKVRQVLPFHTSHILRTDKRLSSFHTWISVRIFFSPSSSDTRTQPDRYILNKNNK